MANQRMYAACEFCSSKEETTFEQCIEYLGKYYPGSGWFARESSMGERFNKFLQAHDHRMQDGGNFGKYVRIIYDSEFSQFAKERDQVLQSVGRVLSEDTP
jgi:hypothetical protein